MLWFLIGILLLSTFLDIYTAFTNPVFELAETNPIYVLTGSKLPLLAITIVFTIWVMKNAWKSISIPKLFTFVSVMVYMIFAHGVGVYANWNTEQAYNENPEAMLEAIENYNTGEKIQTYSMIVGFLVMIPFILGFLSFWITMFFYDKRKPKRDKITDKIFKLVWELKKR